MLPKYPFRGLKPFRFLDKDIFTGRENEVIDIYKWLLIYRSILVHGNSGVGKSSLINAGLIPKLLQKQFLPERITVNPDLKSTFTIKRIRSNDNENIYLPSIFDNFIEKERPNDRKINLSFDQFKETVYKYKLAEKEDDFDFENSSENKNKNPFIVLIFDQFEELITQFEEKDTPFINYDERTELQKKIILLIKDLYFLKNSLNLKLVFVFRDDYLARFDKLFKLVPDLKSHLYRVGNIKLDLISPIIQQPFNTEEKRLHFINFFPEEIIEKLSNKIIEYYKSNAVELTHVQIICSHVYNIKKDNRNSYLNTTGVDQILQQFYLDLLNSLSAVEKNIAVDILSLLVLNEKTRNIYNEEAIVDDLKKMYSPALIKHVIEKLEQDIRVVRKEIRRGTNYYEIVSEAIIPYINRIKIEKEIEKNSVKKRKKLYVYSGAGLSLFVLFTLYFLIRSVLDRQQIEADLLKVQIEKNNQKVAFQLAKQKGILESMQQKESLDSIENELVTRKNKADLDHKEIEKKFAVRYSDSLEKKNKKLELALQIVQNKTYKLEIQNDLRDSTDLYSLQAINAVSKNYIEEISTVLYQFKQDSLVNKYQKFLSSVKILSKATYNSKFSPLDALSTAQSAWQVNKNTIADSLILYIANNNLFYKQQIENENNYENQLQSLFNNASSYSDINNYASLDISAALQSFAYESTDSIINGSYSDGYLAINKNLPLSGCIGFKNTDKGLVIIKDGLFENSGLSLQEQGKKILEIQRNNSKINVSPDSKYLIISTINSDTCELWNFTDLQNGKKSKPQLLYPSSKTLGIVSVVFAPDSKHVLISYADDADGTNLIWHLPLNDSAKPSPLNINKINPKKIRAVNFAADGKSIISLSGANRITFWTLSGDIFKSILLDGLDELSFLNSENNLTNAIFTDQHYRKIILKGSYYNYVLVQTVNEDSILHFNSDRSAESRFKYKSIYGSPYSIANANFLNDSAIISIDEFGSMRLWNIYHDFKNVHDVFTSLRPANDLLNSNDVNKLKEAAGNYLQSYYKNYNLADLDSSKNLYNRLIKINPDISRSIVKKIMEVNDLLYSYGSLSYDKKVEYVKQNIEFAKRDSILITPYRLSYYYGRLSWNQIWIEDFKNALTSAEIALDIYPENTWIFTNLALSYLFNHDFENAKKIYRIYKDKSDYEGPLKKSFLDDFDAVKSIIQKQDDSVQKEVEKIKTTILN